MQKYFNTEKHASALKLPVYFFTHWKTPTSNPYWQCYNFVILSSSNDFSWPFMLQNRVTDTHRGLLLSGISLLPAHRLTSFPPLFSFPLSSPSSPLIFWEQRKHWRKQGRRALGTRAGRSAEMERYKTLSIFLPVNFWNIILEARPSNTSIGSATNAPLACKQSELSAALSVHWLLMQNYIALNCKHFLEIVLVHLAAVTELLIWAS